VLTRDVVLEDFAQEDWLRLLGVLGFHGERPQPRAGGIVALTTNGKLRKLLSTTAGPIDPLDVPWPALPEEISIRFGATWALVLEVGALTELMDRWAVRLRPEHGFTEQCLELLRCARELEAEGRITTWPRRIAGVPLLGEGIVLRALDLICPDGKAMIFGAFDRGHVYTCLVAQRRGPGFARLVGPERLRRDMGLSSGDWTRDCHRLARAAELSVGSLAYGCFAEQSTWRRLLRDRTPGSWAAAVATREVVLHPLGPAVALPLGLDVGRVAYRTVRSIAHRIAGGTLAAGFTLGPTIDRVRGAVSRPDEIAALLGFDPMRLLRELLDGDGSKRRRG
jgi:hypothetical protein